MTFDIGVPLRVGVLSFAHPHALGYVRLLQQLPDVEVLATDPGRHRPDERRGAALAADLDVAYADSAEELMAWRPDAVIVTSENARHREHVELAAAAGAHILCEKPLATSLQDGRAIRDAVEAAGVQLMVAFPVRFASSVARVRAMLAAGELGTPIAVRGSNNGKLPLERAWFTDPVLSGGGALVDHVVHLADVIEALTGAVPRIVTAATNRILHADRAGAETAGLVTIEYDGGLIATIDCSWSRPDSAPTWGGVRFNLLGTRGTVEVDVFGPRAHGLDSATGRPIELPYGQDFDATMLATFIAAVRTGVPSQPDVRVGLRTLGIVVAAQESSRTGHPVRVVEE